MNLFRNSKYDVLRALFLFVVLAFLFPFFASAATTLLICPTLTKTLTVGSKNSEVVLLKKFLIQQGLLPTGLSTTYFGVQTQTAVKAFQKKQGIVSSGTPATTGYGAVGKKTRAAILMLRCSVVGLKARRRTRELFGFRTCPVRRTFNIMDLPVSFFTFYVLIED